MKSLHYFVYTFSLMQTATQLDGAAGVVVLLSETRIRLKVHTWSSLYDMRWVSEHCFLPLPDTPQYPWMGKMPHQKQSPRSQMVRRFQSHRRQFSASHGDMIY
ncbi:hypothetical protein PCAR4_1210004 [Paraburkholderia caribensis]|nr:hypothetical protein PCAR4_1210004 [Paraburkholderia caribensis]